MFGNGTEVEVTAATGSRAGNVYKGHLVFEPQVGRPIAIVLLSKLDTSGEERFDGDSLFRTSPAELVLAKDFYLEIETKSGNRYMVEAVGAK